MFRSATPFASGRSGLIPVTLLMACVASEWTHATGRVVAEQPLVPLTRMVQELPFVRGEAEPLDSVWRKLALTFSTDADDAGQRAWMTQAIADLSEAVDGGIRPGSFGDRKIAKVTLKDEWGFRSEGIFDNQAERCRDWVLHHLQRRISRDNRMDAAERLRLGRLLLALSSHEGYPWADGRVSFVLDLEARAPFLDLDKEDRTRLLEANRDFVSRQGRVARSLIVAADAFDPLLDDKLMHDTSKRGQLLAAIEQGWTDGRGYPSLQYSFARLLFQYACLEASRRNAKAMDDVRAAVERMRQHAECGHTQRWLDEVLRHDGPRPTSSGIQVIRDPNQLKPSR